MFWRWCFNTAYERMMPNGDHGVTGRQGRGEPASRAGRFLGRFLWLYESLRTAVRAALGVQPGAAPAAGLPAAAPLSCEPAAEPREADYDAAIEQAFQVARRHHRHLRSQEAQAQRILQRLEAEDEMEAVGKLPHATGTLAKYMALRDRSWALRHENPYRMVQLALLALGCARQLDAGLYGAELVSDFQCRAQADLGNALRVAQRLDEAEAAMGRARQLFALGTKSASVEIHLLDLEASLDADRRRFKDAIARLEKIYRYHRMSRNPHLAGRALLMQGFYTDYADDPVKALEILQRSLDLIDASRDPGLAYIALHNQIWILCDCGRFREAERQLVLLRPLQQHGSGRITELKLRWTEGRIDAGLERLESAEKTLVEAREGMQKAGRPYDAALVSLDLAAVLLARRKSRPAADVVAVAYETFMALRIEREAVASLLILKAAFEAGLADRAMVEEVVGSLRRQRRDPAAPSPPRPDRR